MDACIYRERERDRARARARGKWEGGRPTLRDLNTKARANNPEGLDKGLAGFDTTNPEGLPLWN